MKGGGGVNKWNKQKSVDGFQDLPRPTKVEREDDKFLTFVLSAAISDYNIINKMPQKHHHLPNKENYYLQETYVNLSTFCELTVSSAAANWVVAVLAVCCNWTGNCQANVARGVGWSWMDLQVAHT